MTAKSHLPASRNATLAIGIACNALVSCGVCNASESVAALAGDTNRGNNSTFVLGENVELTFQASGLTATKATALALKVSDEFGNEISSTSISMTADSSGRATATFTAPASKFGYYRADASLPDGTALAALGSRPAGFVTYAIVPDPAKRINYGDAGSRFGMQGGFNLAQGSVIPYLGVRYVLGSGWRDLEPKSAGQFAATRKAAIAKRQVYPAKSPVTEGITYKGMAWATYTVPLLTSAKMPSWAIEPGTAGKNCPNMGALNSSGVSGFSDFAQALATQVATDYPDQSTHYYQVTWEPADWCFGGTPQQLVQFYELSYAAIHKADAKAVVMGPTLFPEDTKPLSQLWSLGLAAYLDAVSMHPYVKWPPETNGLVGNIRTQMQMARDAKGRGIPFVGTEHGYTSGSLGELNDALGDIRATIILLGEGFKFDFAFFIADYWEHSPTETKNTYGYYWNLNPKLDFGTDKLGPKPVVPAYAAMTAWLDGTSTSGPVSNLSGTQMGYRFTRNGNTILALWDYGAASSNVSLSVPDASVQVCNWMGNCRTAASTEGRLSVTLGSSPTYVIGQHL